MRRIISHRNSSFDGTFPKLSESLFSAGELSVCSVVDKTESRVETSIQWLTNVVGVYSSLPNFGFSIVVALVEHSSGLLY